jgi:hypothetical protein
LRGFFFRDYVCSGDRRWLGPQREVRFKLLEQERIPIGVDLLALRTKQPAQQVLKLPLEFLNLQTLRSNRLLQFHVLRTKGGDLLAFDL